MPSPIHSDMCVCVQENENIKALASLPIPRGIRPQDTIAIPLDLGFSIRYPRAVHIDPKPYSIKAELGVALHVPSLNRFIPAAKVTKDKTLEVQYPLYIE